MMGNNKTWLAWVAGALVIGGAAAWMLLARSEGHAQVATVPESDDTHAAATAKAATGDTASAPGQVRVKRDAAGMPVTWPPLPPIEAPFASIASELKRRADAGDPKAACRLALEVDRCSRVKEQIVAMDARMRWMQDNPQAGQRRQRGNNPAEMVDIGEQLLADDASCQGAPALTPMEKYGYLRQAALSGHIPAMVEYATGNAFRMRDTLESLPALATYRNEAEALARRAAASGDTGALVALAGAYSPARNEGRPNLLLQVIEPDAAESLALYQQVQQQLSDQGEVASPRLRRFVDEQISRVQELATPAQRAEAESRVQQRATQWQAPTSDPTAVRAGQMGGIRPEHCDMDNFVR